MSAADPFAVARKSDGLLPYVRTMSSWGRESDTIVYASSLRDAKSQHGWTRQQHTSVKVRRARVSDMTTESSA